MTIKVSTIRRFLLTVLLALVIVGGVTPVLAQPAPNGSNTTNGTDTSAYTESDTNTYTDPNTSNQTTTAQLGAGTTTGSLPQADVVIRSSEDFSQLDAGETAVVPPDATIQMPVSEAGTVIPQNARLLSNGGTLVYQGSPKTGRTDPEHMLILESGAQIRGLNIVGPIAGRTESDANNGEFGFAGRKAVMIGVTVRGQGTEISRSTIRGWPAANVRFVGDSSGRVIYSRITGAFAGDRGYGVSVIQNGNAVIAASYFNRNRHSVEAGGSGSYTVTDSVIGPDHVSHALDVHPPAGGRYVYRNLTVMAERGLAMRQVPEGGAIVQNVWFTQASPENAIYQIDQRRVSGGGRTHAGPEIANAQGGYDDFRNMQFQNIYIGENAPPGVGAPASMPHPSEIPSAGGGLGLGGAIGGAIIASLVAIGLLFLPIILVGKYLLD